MEHVSNESQPNPSPNEQTGFFRRLTRAVLDRLLPPESYVPPPSGEINLDDAGLYQTGGEQIIEASDTAEPEPEPTSEAAPSVAVRLDTQGSFFVTSDEAKPVGPLTTKYESRKLFHDLSRLFMSVGEGEHAVADIAAEAAYKPLTVSRVANRLAGLFPAEVITVSGNVKEEKRVRFGNLALSSLLPDQSQETPGEKNPHQEASEQVNKGKVDLLSKAHVIITPGGSSEEQFYLPLHTPAAMLAARVIESLRHLRDNDKERNVQSAQVAERVWQKMTVAERQLFVEDEETVLLSNAWVGVEASVLLVLRGLTHKLMLTHERYSDRFTLLDTTFNMRLQYSKQPLTEKQAAKHPNLRPIIPTEQIADAPEQAKQAEYKDLARAYMQRAKKRTPITNQGIAIDMMGFLMSPNGHWAVRAVAGEEGLFRTHDRAMNEMHAYLRKQLGPGYGPAYKSRLIGGDRRVRQRGENSMRQVSGALPGNSKWVLGQGMQEFFGDAVKPKKDS